MTGVKKIAIGCGALSLLAVSCLVFAALSGAPNQRQSQVAQSAEPPSSPGGEAAQQAEAAVEREPEVDRATEIAALRDVDNLSPEVCLKALEGQQPLLEALEVAERWPVLLCAWRSDESTRRRSIAYEMFLLAADSPPPRDAASEFQSAMMSLAEDARQFAGPSAGFDIFDLEAQTLSDAKASLESLFAVCRRCSQVSSAREHRAWLEKWLSNFPVQMPNTDAYKLRYADLRNKNVRMRGQLAASTYHNCAFRSSSRWRSFTFSTRRGPLAGMTGLHVYCRNGERWCDELYDQAVTANARGGVDANVVLQYPRSNRICEEGQSELVHARSP